MEETEQVEKVTTRSAGVRYGVISGVIGIALFVGMTILSISMTEGPGRWVGLLITGVLIYFAHKYYKDNGDGYMTIGQGTGIGFWLALVSTAISSVFSYIYMKFIDASFIENAMDEARRKMEEQGNLSDEQIDQAMSITEKFMTPEIMLGTGLIFGVILVVIIALIISLITQKKNPEEVV
jgi:CDP-diglyceride synthetase